MMSSSLYRTYHDLTTQNRYSQDSNYIITWGGPLKKVVNWEGVYVGTDTGNVIGTGSKEMMAISLPSSYLQCGTTGKY